MLIIKNKVNKVCLTLSEKASVLGSDFILQLFNEVSGQKTSRVIALKDIGEFTTRTNIFLIEESVNEDLYNSIVSLNPAGQWSYIAYEMASSSPRNLNPAQALKIVEEGICIVKDLQENQNNFFDEDDKKNSVVFEG